MFLDPATVKALLEADLQKKDLQVLLAMLGHPNAKTKDLAEALDMKPANLSRSKKKVSAFLGRPLALDVCCGEGAWLEPDATIIRLDIRKGIFEIKEGEKTRIVKVDPDIIADFKNLPFADSTFSLIAFDPPHLIKTGEKSWLNTKYSHLNENWKDDLKKGFEDCWRVLKVGGTLIFKWNSEQISINDVLKLFHQKPIFGSQKGKTFFKTFLKT